MASLGSLVVTLTAKTGKFRKGMRRAERSLTRFSRKVKRFTMRLGRSIIRWGKWMALAAVAAGAAMTKFAIDAVESENLFTVSMGKMEKAARSWSKELAKRLRLSEFALRKSVGIFNVMLMSMGLGADEAFRFATGLTELAHDMASFYNLAPEDAFQKLRSGMVGLSRPLRQIGILVKEGTVAEVAYRRGLVERGRALTDVQKVQARYMAIMEQTVKAQGDLARTLHDPANQLRAFWALVKDTATTMGMEFLPALSAVVGRLNDFLVVNKKIVASKFAEYVERIGVAMAPLARALGFDPTPTTSSGLQKALERATKDRRAYEDEVAELNRDIKRNREDKGHLLGRIPGLPRILFGRGFEKAALGEVMHRAKMDAQARAGVLIAEEKRLTLLIGQEARRRREAERRANRAGLDEFKNFNAERIEMAKGFGINLAALYGKFQLGKPPTVAPRPAGFAAAHERGSVGAYSAALRGRGQREMQDSVKSTAKNTKATVDVLGRIEDKLGLDSGLLILGMT